MSEADELDELFRAEFTRLVRGLGVAYGVDAAADAVQDAFLAAHRRWRKVRGLDDPAGWVRRVALNRLMNGRRNRARRTRILESLRPAEIEVLPAATIDLHEAVNALPERMRLAVCLHHLSGFTVAEVADSLGVSPGTVKSNLHDARTKLRQVLGDDLHV